MLRVINISMIFFIYLIIMLLVAVFVYRDAKKRNMNALGWALVAFFVPMLLGVIVYLICREPLVDMQCPNCGAGIAKEAKVCPQCDRSLLTQCPECEFPVQKGWKSCPSCGARLPESYEQPVRAYRKDNGFVIIIVVVALSVLGVLLTTFSLANLGHKNEMHFSEGFFGFEGMYNITKEDLSGNEVIVSWIEEADKSNKDVHVLLSKGSDTCLIYVKDNEYLMSSGMTLDYYDEKCEILIDIETSGYEDTYGYDFFFYEFEVYEDTEVRAVIDGYDREAELSVIDEDISMSTWGGLANE